MHPFQPRSHNLPTTIRPVFAFVAVVALLLAACGGDEQAATSVDAVGESADGGTDTTPAEESIAPASPTDDDGLTVDGDDADSLADDGAADDGAADDGTADDATDPGDGGAEIEPLPDDDNEGPGGADDALGPPLEALADYEGLTEAEGRELAASEDRPFRIGRRDDEHFALTMDIIPNRITVELDDGIITAAVLG